MNLISIRCGNIQCDSQPRGSSKELAELVESIREIGLLQPIVLNSKHEIIAGRRRLAACREAGLSHVSAVVCETLSDAKKAIFAERDENTCRVALKPTEMKELADRIRAIEKPKAEERQRDSHFQKSENSSGNDGAGNVARTATGRTDDVASNAAGTSRRTLDKIDEVVDSGDEELIKEMDETGKVDPVHKKLKEKRKPQTQKKHELKDSLGIDVPDDLRDLFGDPFLTDASDRIEKLTKETKSILRLTQGKGPAWAFLLCSEIMAHLKEAGEQLESARSQMVAAKPYAVCPTCNGKGCKNKGNTPTHCRQSGWLPLWRYTELKTGGDI
jgi:hypothetical protein